MFLNSARVFSRAGLFFCGLATLAVLTLPQFAYFGMAAESAALDAGIRTQMTAPIFLSKVMPVGIMGLIFAGVIAAFISTNDSYMLTWAGIIVQDVICPLKKKPLGRKQHIWLLRIVVILVGVFLYFFGLWYKSNEAIIIFQMVTGTIYMAGAGTMVTLGLYWRRGNTAGAYAALITGAAIPILNYILKNVAAANRLFEGIFGIKYNLTGLEGAILAYIAATIMYFLVSLLTKNPRFNLEKMLNRPQRGKENSK